MKHSHQSRLGIIVGAFAFVAINFVLFQNCSGQMFKTVDQVEFYQPPQSQNQDNSANQSSSSPPASSNPPMVCPAVICANPPPGCNYEIDESTKNNMGELVRCPSNCGKIVCNSRPKVCPMISCSQPPSGCHYASAGIIKDANGCSVGCGQIVCDETSGIDQLNINGEIITPIKIKKIGICPLITYTCIIPAANCHYDTTTAIDSNGCQTGCGNMVCDDPIAN